MKKIILGVIALAAVAGATQANAATFSTNLTVGSTGNDVVALQTWLVEKGFLTMPAGVAKGYFGQLTKSAVAAYQATVALPTTGFFGPMTRAKLGEVGNTAVSTPGCPAGMVCTPTTPVVVTCPAGFTCTPVAGSTSVSTTGVEGTLAVTSQSSGLASTVYENDSMVAILGFKAEAKSSDITIQRVKLDLGSSTKFYNKIFKKLYVVESSTGNVLASVDLNSSTVVKDGSTYYVTLAGMNSVVAKGTKKDYLIKADVYSSIDSTDYDVETYPIQLANDGVRGVDGAGIDQYSPATGSSVSRTPTISSDLVDNATLRISTNSATPKAADVIATAGSSENELDKLPVLVFDVKAEKDNVTITDLVVDVTKAGTGGATASTTVYLYDGSTELDSATVSSGSATFSDLDYEVARDATKSLTVKVDVRNANGTVSQIAADIDTADVTAENSRGDSITESGSATGETFYVRNVGPQFVLNSKSATRTSVSSNDTSGVATSTGTGTFSLTITAVGGDISFGSTASTTPAFATTTTTVAAVYKNGSSNGTIEANTAAGTTAVVSYSTPSSGVTTSGETWTLAEGNSVTLDVTFQNTVAANSTNQYAYQLNGVRWYTSANGQQTSTSMLNKAEWRTSTVTLP